jgi:hypothetical protein
MEPALTPAVSLHDQKVSFSIMRDNGGIQRSIRASAADANDAAGPDRDATRSRQ